MAKYLRTSGISAAVETLILEARERLYIISPYLKLSDNIKQLLNDKEREKIEVRIIFGKQELNPTEMSYLQTLKYVRLYFFKNLHAKCYLNEKRMIISSMNLYEFSQQNNREMGILIERADESDKQVYEDAWKDIESILNNATDFAYVSAPKEIEKVKNEPTRQEPTANYSKPTPEKPVYTGANGKGHCIRCNDPIALKPLVPYCKECFYKWRDEDGKEDDFTEGFCHICGKKETTSKEKPSCYKCYTANKNKLEFPIS